VNPSRHTGRQLAHALPVQSGRDRAATIPREQLDLYGSGQCSVENLLVVAYAGDVDPFVGS